MTTARLVLPSAMRRAMIAHARREAPRECCGFIVGAGRLVDEVIGAGNVESGPTRYRVDPADHIALVRALRGTSRNILGVYHSHPNGPAHPSETDVAEAQYPEWAYVIVGLGGTRARIRAFDLTAHRVVEIPIRRWASSKG